MYGSSFSDNEEKLVFQFVGQFDEAKLEATAPSCHLIVLAGEHHFAELFYLFVGIFVGSTTAETVQFLVVVIFYTFADGGQEAILFASLMLSTTFLINLHYRRNFFQFAFLNLLVDTIIIPFPDEHGD
jgi:hypothetical protein